MGKYKCQRPIHPGELLKEEVEERNLPQTKLAEQIGIPYKMLNDILNCRRPLTTSTAMMFEAALSINAGLLMRSKWITTCNRPPKISRLWNGWPRYANSQQCCRKHTKECPFTGSIYIKKSGLTHPASSHSFLCYRPKRINWGLQAALSVNPAHVLLSQRHPLYKRFREPYPQA